jgi:ADP-heptose:LPS heptosyltransferase
MVHLLKSFLQWIFYIFCKARSLNDQNMAMLWSKASRIAVMAASGIGDALMATPLIKAIKQCKPNGRLVVIASETTQSIFWNNRDVDKIYVMPSGNRSIIKYVKFVALLYCEKIEFLFAAQPANVIKCALTTILGGAKIRLKHEYDYGNQPERNFDFVYHRCLPDNMARHRVELNLDFLRYLGEKIPERSLLPQFYTGKEAIEFIKNRLRNEWTAHQGNMIAFHAGGVRPNKRWDIQNYAAVGKSLIGKGYKIVLVGGRDEIQTNLQIKEMVNHPDCINFASQLSLEETAAILKQSKLLISNDTGIMHLATAVDVPVIAIFGPTDYRHIGPYGKIGKVIINKTDIKSVSIDQVNNEIEIFLNLN